MRSKDVGKVGVHCHISDFGDGRKWNTCSEAKGKHCQGRFVFNEVARACLCTDVLRFMVGRKDRKGQVSQGQWRQEQPRASTSSLALHHGTHTPLVEWGRGEQVNAMKC